jgi:hypothetical protein
LIGTKFDKFIELSEQEQEDIREKARKYARKMKGVLIVIMYVLVLTFCHFYSFLNCSTFDFLFCLTLNSYQKCFQVDYFKSFQLGVSSARKDRVYGAVV